MAPNTLRELACRGAVVVVIGVSERYHSSTHSLADDNIAERSPVHTLTCTEHMRSDICGSASVAECRHPSSRLPLRIAHTWLQASPRRRDLLHPKARGG